MRRLIYYPSLITVGALAACAGPRPGPAAGAAIPGDANAVVAVSEAVADPSLDAESYLKISIDGKEAGQTPIAAKSSEKKWGARLPGGNHLFRFEYWVLISTGGAGQWSALASQWQPIERFVRVDDKERVLVALKFFDGARKHSYQIFRDAFIPNGPK